jgi:16S rRNA (uracil1498-N3)-methyltransferase
MNASIRLYLDAALAEGAALDATAAQAHYLHDVMRRPLGATLRLFNGRDGEWSARVEALGRNGARLAVGARLRPQEPEPDIWLLFAALRRDATEWVVQKATELGAARLLPVLTARTQPARLNLDRLRAIATEAAEQSERLTVPSIDGPERLADKLAAWPAGRPLLACVERADAPVLTRVMPPAALLVGPEGGFTDEEQRLLASVARPVSLGPRVLRAETAALAGLAMLLLPLAAPPPAP